MRGVDYYAGGAAAGPPLHFGDCGQAAGPQHRAAAPAPEDWEPLLEGRNDARTGMPGRLLPGAMCVQRFDDSLNSAIHITYRISLRSSSMPEPRDPLLKVFTCFCFKSEHAVRFADLEFGAAGGGRAVRRRGASPTPDVRPPRRDNAAVGMVHNWV